MVAAALVLSALSGCRGRESDSASLPPLEARALGAKNVALSVPEGATTAREVLLVLAKSPEDCRRWLGASKKIGVFGICTSAPPSSAESDMKSALKQLKSAYSSYIRTKSLHVVSDLQRPTEALTLVMKEPSVFRALAVVSEQLDELGHVWVSTFGAKGGGRLVVVGGGSETEEALRLGARGTALRVKRLPGPAEPAAVLEALFSGS